MPRARFIEDGKFVTSAGVSAGIDMALEPVAEDVPSAAAGRKFAATQAFRIRRRLRRCWCGHVSGGRAVPAIVVAVHVGRAGQPVPKK